MPAKFRPLRGRLPPSGPAPLFAAPLPPARRPLRAPRRCAAGRRPGSRPGSLAPAVAPGPARPLRGGPCPPPASLRLRLRPPPARALVARLCRCLSPLGRSGLPVVALCAAAGSWLLLWRLPAGGAPRAAAPAGCPRSSLPRLPAWSRCAALALRASGRGAFGGSAALFGPGPPAWGFGVRRCGGGAREPLTVPRFGRCVWSLPWLSRCCPPVPVALLQKEHNIWWLTEPLRQW